MLIKNKFDEGLIGIMAGKALAETVYFFVTDGNNLRNALSYNKAFSQDMVHGFYEGFFSGGPAVCLARNCKTQS